MKKTTKPLILAACTALCLFPASILTASPDAKNRVPAQLALTGNYYDYMIIETVDGCHWFLDNTPSLQNPYIKYEAGRYIPAFEDGQLVQVLFDTKGTADVTDDSIICVRSIDSRYPS